MTPSEKALRRERNIKLAAFVGLLSLFLLFLFFIQKFLVSFILALVIYYLLSPVVDRLERLGFSRGWSVMLPFISLSGLGFFMLSRLAPIVGEQFLTLQVDVPRYAKGTLDLIQRIQAYITELAGPNIQFDLVERAQPFIAQWTADIFQGLPQYIGGSLTTLFLSPFLGIFLLLDGRKWSRQLLELVPNNIFELVLYLQYQVSYQLGGFIRARLLQSALITAIIWIGLYSFLDFPYAILLALFAGLANLIPYLGPVIGALPAFFIALVNNVDSGTLLVLAGIYVFAQIIDNIFIVPFVVARIVNLHPVTVVGVVIVGAQLMGILGMIISIPMAAVIKVITFTLYRHLTEFRS